MADNNCKVQSETEYKCDPKKFYEYLKYSLHHLSKIFSGCTHSETLEGDGESVGSLGLWKYFLPGSTEEHTVKARTKVQDDEKMLIEFFVEDGDIHNHYQYFKCIIQVFPKGEGCLVKWTVEAQKHHDEIPDPHNYLEFYHLLSQSVESHLN